MISGGDDRGISELAGAMLVFAAIIITLSAYQAMVVPAQNERAEFDHNLRLQSDMQDLRGAIINAPSRETPESVTIELGIRYPARQLLVNPAPPVGTLETNNGLLDGPNISIENAEATGEVGDYWDGGTHEYSTTAITYRPGYNQYTNAPSTNYESSVVYNRFNDTLIPLTSQSIVDGKRINLIAISGTLSRSDFGTTSVDVRSISPGHRTVSVSNTAAPLRISVPTRLDLATWQDLLDGEFVANGTGGHIENLDVVSVTDSEFDLLIIELETGVNYDLKLAEVAVGQNPDEPEIGYVTPVSANVTSITTDEEQLLVVEVRDRFDNPVSGVEVTFETNNGTFTGDTSPDTDSQGQASVVFSANAAGEATIQAGIDSGGGFGSEPDEHIVTFTVFINSN